MSSNDYDPRGKANRALLVGVYHYRHDVDLPGVRHNLGELYPTLLRGGVFGAEEIVPVSPVRRVDFLTHLDKAADEARGLLLFYFAGHGRLSHGGDELCLALGDTRRVEGDKPTYAEAISWNHDVLPKLRDIAAHRLVDRIVVILDCCNAGNALEEFKAGAVHPGRDRISVLTAVQVNRRIPSGNGSEPTPYTKQLVRLLREGLPAQQEVAGASRRLLLVPLAAALRQAMRGQRVVHGDPWEPRHHLAESGQDVLLGLVPEPPPPARGEPRWASALRRLGARPGTLRKRLRDRPRRPSVPLLAALAVVLAAAGGFGGYRLAAGSPACAPPVELRLLTDPDTAPTVQRAVDTYLDSAGDHDAHGCRRSGISVVAPKSADVVDGFAHADQWQRQPDKGTFHPQRDIGPQPDIWIPGSDVTYQRAATAAATTGKNAARLDSLGSLAYSPIVLAVPSTLSYIPANQTGHQLADLVGQFESGNQKKHPVVLRADPEYTDSAQLATVGLYDRSDPATQLSVPKVEQQAALVSPAPRDSYELMCALAGTNPLDEQAAVLVPEQVMAQFNDRTGTRDQQDCNPLGVAHRLPEYPANVGMLDLPFVQVGWQGATRDAKARLGAIDAFHGWLAGPEGQRVFTAAGYRGSTDREGTPAAPGDNSWLVTDEALREPSPIGRAVSPAEVSGMLDRYRVARGPGRVLYLLDSSASMGDLWSKAGDAKDLLAQSLDPLGAKDAFGIWSVVGKGAGYVPTVPFGANSVAAARQKLGALAVGDDEAFPELALPAALSTLKALGQGDTADRPSLIVFLTDDEDDNHLDGTLASLLQEVAADRIPVDWVSLASGGCSDGKTGRRIADASGGRCLDTSGSQASALRDAVAQVGTGDTS